MKYKEYLPHASLQGHVKCLWIMERTYTPASPIENVTPDAYIELILNLGAPYRLHTHGAPDREMPRAILVGLQKKPLIFRCEGTVKLVATRFFAWGGLAFLPNRARGLTNLSATLAREWDDLTAQIEAAVATDNYDAAVSRVEDHLIEKLLTATVDLKQIQTAAHVLHLCRRLQANESARRAVPRGAAVRPLGNGRATRGLVREHALSEPGAQRLRATAAKRFTPARPASAASPAPSPTASRFH